MQTRKHLLETLADGEFHSGEALGKTLGVSRMAVWKHLKALRENGVGFEVVRGRGYRLAAPVELLEKPRILGALTPQVRDALGPVEVLLSAESTNNRLLDQALEGLPHASVCLAEQQTAGRGRRGRTWVSPFAENLYLSLLVQEHGGVAALGGLSLVAGIAVLRALQQLGVDQAGLKWPNDIVAGDAKLAGILIDVKGESGGPCSVVIGIGINVNMSRPAAERIDQPWTDLQALTGQRISRNALAAGLLEALIPAVGLFESQGLQPFMEDWRRYDLVAGRNIELHLPNAVVHGTGCGIDASGSLLVDTPDGRKRFASGEVTLRVAS